MYRILFNFFYVIIYTYTYCYDTYNSFRKKLYSKVFNEFDIIKVKCTSLEKEKMTTVFDNDNIVKAMYIYLLKSLNIDYDTKIETKLEDIIDKYQDFIGVYEVVVYHPDGNDCILLDMFYTNKEGIKNIIEKIDIKSEKSYMNVLYSDINHIEITESLKNYIKSFCSENKILLSSFIVFLSCKKILKHEYRWHERTKMTVIEDETFEEKEFVTSDVILLTL